jgi:hypothetical protein
MIPATRCASGRKTLKASATLLRGICRHSTSNRILSAKVGSDSASTTGRKRRVHDDVVELAWHMSATSRMHCESSQSAGFGTSGLAQDVVLGLGIFDGHVRRGGFPAQDV